MPDRKGARPVEVVTEDELTPSYGLRRGLRDALPLLAGVGFLMAGTSLTATLLGIRAGLEGFSPAVTGLVLSAFYAGFLVGSLVTPRTIWRVGHVRVFAGLASLASAAVLVHVVRPEPLTWLVLRATSGLCLAGLYVAAETWLNGAATNSTRGSLLAVYMVVVTAGQGAGQLLFPVADPRGHAAFVLASVLVSMAVVPVSLATVSPPEVGEVERLSFRELTTTAPLAVGAAAISGFSGAAVLGGGGAIFAAAAGLSRGQTSALLSAALLGALLLQVPFGRWSDTTDRRRVLVAATAMGVVAAGLAAAVPSRSIVPLVLLTGLVGGTSFLLYSLANAHLNDNLAEQRTVGGGAAMVLVYGAGAVAGPMAVSAGIDVVGPEALYLMVGVSYAAVVALALWRMAIRAAVPEDERVTYAAMPAGTAPTVASLSDASPEPVEAAALSTDTGPLRYRVQGHGPPVVLLGAAPNEVAWERLLQAFAANSTKAIGVGLRGAVREDERPRDDVLAVLHELGLPSATFVGLNGGAVQVAQLVAEHPERADAVVFAGPALPVSADQTELDGRGLLVLSDDRAMPYWEQPELFADAVVDFLRHLSREPS